MSETTNSFNKYWALITFLLIVIIALGSIAVWSRSRGSQPIEISIPQVQELQGEIYIGGAVNNPGFSPLRRADNIESLIQAAGGTTSSGDLSQVKLYIPSPGEGEQPQKVDINQAEAWLLMALPGIGEARAEAIVDYRRRNGPFRNINELTKVEDIGTTTYGRIRHLITVAD
ncbi:helix-hairpin-helix domain-containing protein [Chloroflexota bacterium]